MSEMPVVEVHIVASDVAPTGIGEPGVPVIAPAISKRDLRRDGPEAALAAPRPERVEGGLSPIGSAPPPVAAASAPQEIDEVRRQTLVMGKRDRVRSPLVNFEFRARHG